MTPREEAISDCKYARSLGETALNQHYMIWRGHTVVVDSYNDQYAATVMEIWDKLNTPECLLEK